MAAPEEATALTLNTRYANLFQILERNTTGETSMLRFRTDVVGLAPDILGLRAGACIAEGRGGILRLEAGASRVS